MSDQIFFDGKRFISANEASVHSGLTRDYVAKLCRDGKVSGRRVGKNWYVEHSALQNFLVSQEYARTKRRESLSADRAREYHSTEVPAEGPVSRASTASASTGIKTGTNAHASERSFVRPDRETVADAITARTSQVQKVFASAAASRSPQALRQASGFAMTPGAIDAADTAVRLSAQSMFAMPAHAALPSIHVPVHVVTPVIDFVHKLVALTLAFMFTFGTYALVDPQYARFAFDSVQDTSRSIAASYTAVTGGGASAFAERAQTSLAVAAENPGAAVASASYAIGNAFPNAAAKLARAVNSGVDRWVYAISFPPALINSFNVAFGAGDGTGGSVSVQIQPYARPASNAGATPSTTAPRLASATVVQGPRTVITNPVVERIVETQRILTVGGISEEMLSERLNGLENKLMSQLYSITSSASTLPASGGFTNNIALTNRIDHLSSVTLTNPTITGGTISGVALSAGDITGTIGIAHGGTGTSTAPSYGQLFVGDSAGGYTLMATSSLGIGGASLTDANTWSALQLFSANASSSNFSNFGTAYFGGTATSTFDSAGNLSVAGTLSVTGTTTLSGNLSAVNATSTTFFATTASSTNLFASSATLGTLSLSAGTTTNFFSTTASSTNLFAQTATLGVLNAGTLAFTSASTTQFSVFQKAYFGGTATSTFDSTGFLTLPSGFFSLASSTIGDGTQAGGLTISGGATTTGDFVISKASAPTTGSVYFGNGTANLNYNSSDFTFTGGSLYTSAGRITSIGLNESTGVGVRYVNGDGTYYVGATHSATPDFVFTNNDNLERARLTDAGYFGIGTTSPWKMLSVAGDIIGTNITATGTVTTNGLVNTGTFSQTGLASFSIASTSLLSVFNKAYFGGTATSTFDSSGNLLVAGTLDVTGNTTLANATSTSFFATTASSTNLFASSATVGTLSLSAGTTTNLFSTTASSTNLYSANGTIGVLSAGTLNLTSTLGVSGLATFASGFVSQASSTVVGNFTSTGIGSFASGAFTASSGTTTIASGQGFTVGGSQFVVQEGSGRVGIGTAAPTVGFDVGVATKISGDLTVAGGSTFTISASGPINQTGTGQVTFAGNVDATNGLDVTNANFTVGGSNFIVAPSTGNTTVAGTFGLTGAAAASSTLQVTGASRFYSSLWTGGALTAAAAGTGLSVTNDASIGGTLALTGAATFSSTLGISGLLTAATTTFTGDVALSGKKITGVASPSADQDAANKTYVDSVAQGLSLKDSVRAGTTANITISGEQTIDGVSLVAGDRILVKDQSDQTKNGIYVVAAGAWSRATDADTDSEVTSGMFTFITDGTANASSGWVLTTTGAITLGTSLLSFTQFSGAGQIVAGTGITKTGNTLNVIGTTDRITSNADSIDIASTYVGQSSITTVGALTSGSLGAGFGNINIGASSITGGVATFSSIVGSAINGTGDLTISGSGTFSNGLSVVGTLTAATTTFSGDVALGGKKITGLADPTAAQEAATKAYVDAIAQGLTVKASVRAGTTGNITLSGAQTIDGVAVIAGDRVLVKSQSTGSENGIYVAAAGAWSRSTDADTNSEVVSGVYAFITEGTTQANTGWSLITPNTITLDTTSLTFTQFSGSAETTAGNGLTKTGNTINTVGTADRITVSADSIDIASTYAGQSSILTVGTLTSGAIGSGFGAINIGSSALTAGAATFASAKSFGSLLIGGTATTTISGDSATSTFSGGLSLAGGNVNIATGGSFLINNVLALSATTLGSSVLSSSLTSVGPLDSGSITTGFGAINIGSDTLDAGATTLASLTVSAGATTTSLFSTTASSTNLYSTNGNIGVLTAGTLNLTTLSATNGTFSGTLGVTGLSSLNGGLTAYASSTIGAGGQTTGLTISGGATTTGNAYFGGNVGIATTSPNSLLSIYNTTNSPTTLLSFSGLNGAGGGISVANGQLYVNGANGTAVFRVANNKIRLGDGGSNVGNIETGSNSISFNGNSNTAGLYFDSSDNATLSAKLNVISGLTTYASSTIGNGTQTGGLTISGGATTTGNAYFAGNVGIGTTSPAYLLDVQSAGNTIARLKATTGTNPAVLQFNNNGTGFLGLESSTGGSVMTNGLAYALVLNNQSANALQLGTSNTAQMTILSTGNVGIGSTTPASQLTVYSAASGQTPYLQGGGSMTIENGGTPGINLLGANTGGGRIYFGAPSSQYAGFFEYYHNATLASGHLDFGAGGAVKMTILGNGNVGIGTTTPGVKLDVNGVFRVASTTFVAPTTGAGLEWSYRGNGTGYLTVYDRDAHTYQPFTVASGAFGVNTDSTGVNNFTIDTSGRVGIGTTTPAATLDVNGSGFFTSRSVPTMGAGLEAYYSSGASGLLSYDRGASAYKPLGFDASDQHFYINSVEKVTLNASGNVGIGTTNPAYTLDVNGPIRNINFQSTAVSQFLNGSNAQGIKVGSLWVSSGYSGTAPAQGAYIQGNVGIGTTTPRGKLEVAEATDSTFYTSRPAANTLAFNFADASNSVTSSRFVGYTHQFYTSASTIAAGTEAMRINSSGNVGIGTTTPGSIFSVNNILNLTAATSTFYSTGGINLAAGCFSIAGECVGGGGSAAAGAEGNIQFYSGGLLSANSNFTWDNINFRLGVGTSTPFAKFAISLNSGETYPGNNAFLIASSTPTGTTTLFSVSNAGVTTFGSSGGTGDANLQFASDSNAWMMGYNSSDKSFRIASSTDLTSSVAFTLTKTGFLGLGTTTPWAKLSVAGAAGGTDALFTISSSSAAFATTTVFHVDSNGNVGIGTSTPGGKFAVQGSGTGTGVLAKFFNGAFTAVMSVLDNGTAYFLGNVGIGTTTPTRKLSVSDTVASAQVALAYDDTRVAELRVDSTGDMHLAASGGDFYLNNDNLWVCTGGSITTGGCPSGTPTGVGNIIAENKLGIGTTTPAYKLTIETQDTTTNFFQIASSTAQNLFVVNANGKVGIGTSTPFARLAVGPNGSIMTTEGTLTDGATITVSWLDGNQQKVTLGGNRTINFTNYIAGAILRLVVCQDATGSRTITWDSSVLWQGGSAPTLTTTANKCDLATFVATGATSTLKIFGAAALAF